MTDLFSEYRRKSGAREDPRLARRNSKTSNSNEHSKQQYDKLGVPISPKRNTPSPSHNNDLAVADLGWQSHQSQHQTAQYNSSMQTAYQHLPPAMYSDHSQYNNQGYLSTYGAYPQQSYVPQSGGYSYQNYNQQTGYSTGTIQPGPPGEEYPGNEWVPVGAYNNVAHQMPSHHPQPTQHQPVDNSEEYKKDAVAQELKQQKAQMAKQREDYVLKMSVLRRELDLLRNQKQELLAAHSSEHEKNHILKENSKLQVEIQNKMKTINNIIEMLTNIIGDHQKVSDLEKQFQEESPKQRREKKRSVSSENVDLESKFFYVYYDPELHWCRICDVFPKSAKEYLLHLHSKEHLQITHNRDMVDTPWHRLTPEPEMPSVQGAPKKRMPIKGLQFLISASAWYCKLCDTWVGDLHCASQHLKSVNHNQNYVHFVDQNPHWEIEWLRDREKALTRTSKDKASETEDSDNEEASRKSKKRRDKHSPSDIKKDKKRKKQKKRKKHSSDSSSSSSSSDSSTDDDANDDKSKSIRVAMRNKMKLQAQMIMNEDVGGKWEVLGRLVEEQKRKENAAVAKVEKEDTLINQWMTVSEPQDKDRQLFDDLKDRMKQKQEAEKARLAEIHQRQKEAEQKEMEQREKQAREEREAKELEEKRRQQEELARITDKDREQIRFKTKEKYRRRSASVSPERHKSSRYSKSPSPEHRKRDKTPDRYHRDRDRDNHHSENGRRTSDRRRSSSYDGRGSPKRKYKHDKDLQSRDSEKKDKRRQLSHRKPHFIGRMPLFKNKKNEDRVEKEIKKEDYDIPRQSRFQPGNLARAFIPEPEVVCFPRLSSIPPLMIPPPPVVHIPDPPKISKEEVILKAPPPPKINDKGKKKPASESQPVDNEDDQSMPPPPPPPASLNEVSVNEADAKPEYQEEMNMYVDPSQVGMDSTTMMQYQYNMDYNAMMYSQMYDYSQEMLAEDSTPRPPEDVPVEHTLPLQPPPLPPDDPNEDLAMLGISADDMAAQMF